MSARLLPVIVAVVSVLLGSAVAFKDRRPDCSAIIEKATFDTYKHICAAVDTSQLVEYSNTNKWDIVETCTCNLLSHELAWSVMLTHEAESMYVALINLIDSLDSAKDAKVGVPKNSTIFESLGPEGIRMYYWDRLDNIFNELGSMKDHMIVAAKFYKALTGVYYDPKKFQFQFDEEATVGMEASIMVTETCKFLSTNMIQFMVYFNRLSDLSGNERYLFRVTSYSEDLHKIRMIMKYCQVMSVKGVVIA